MLARAQEPGAAALAAPPHGGEGNTAGRGRAPAGASRARGGRAPLAEAADNRLRRLPFQNSSCHLLWGAKNGGLGLCSCLLKRAETKSGKMAC